MFDEYFSQFEGKTKERLEHLYKIITATLGGAEEKISYGVPTFYGEKGYIVYFAGYKEFVSMYPVHQATNMSEELKPYMSGKSTARFYHDKPLPEGVIVKTVKQLKINYDNRKEK